MHEIRYEELAESVRNVFWLSHRLVYDGASSNIGWYGMLLIAYKLFGFSLYSAKFVRLSLHFLALTCCADILRRWMGYRTAIVPLVAIGLSPTILYFNSLQTSNGIDLPYAAICLWLLLSVQPDSRAPSELGKTFLCGMVAMIAAMSYPTFLLYLPSLLVASVWWMRQDRSGRGWKSWYGVSATIGLAFPLVIASGFLITPSLLFWDPITHAGLFRGAGILGFDPSVMRHSLSAILSDLLVQGRSYLFEVSHPDWSGPVAIAGLCCISGTTIYLWLNRQVDIAILFAAALLLAVSLVVPGLSIDGSAGIRRSTRVLAAYFVLFSVTWHFYRTWAPANSCINWVRRTGMLVCLLVPLDSAFKLPSLLNDLTGDSKLRNHDWFTISATPTESLQNLLEQLDKGQRLSCPVNNDRLSIPCRYQEVYAAMAGYLLWNSGSTAEIRALDWKTGHDIVLTPALWTSYYFSH
jgi:hypothetical protein